MTLTLTLYQNRSDNKSVSKALTAGPTYTCTIKRDCTVEEPYFLLEKGTTDISQYNYAYCAEFGRYYFIRERNLTLGGLYELHCYVDALYSFSGGIRSLQAVVERQEFIFNPYLEDAGIIVSQGSVVSAIKGPKVGEDTYSIYLTAVGSHQEDPEP